MQFSARIRLDSFLDKTWRGTNRAGGRVLGVLFTRKGSHYIADWLTAEQIALLRDHPAVELEMAGVAPSMPAERPSETPPKAPIKASSTPPKPAPVAVKPVTSTSFTPVKSENQP